MGPLGHVPRAPCVASGRRVQPQGVQQASPLMDARLLDSVCPSIVRASAWSNLHLDCLAALWRPRGVMPLLADVAHMLAPRGVWRDRSSEHAPHNVATIR